MKRILPLLMGLVIATSCEDDDLIHSPCERLLRLNPNHPCGSTKEKTIAPSPVTNPITPTPTSPKDNLPTQAINNHELIAALAREGYTFKGNELVLNDKFTQTKELNLSNAGLKNLTDLQIFTNLERINLQGNNFDSFVFDTADLPPTVQYVNLQDNNLYAFKNLAHIDANGNYVVERSFKEIIFPAQARFNVEHLLPYYKGCKGCSMKIQNTQTDNLEPLTAHRHIPSKTLYELLKAGTLNLGNQFIDATQSINLEEPLRIQLQLGVRETNTQNGMNPTDLEGIEFVINNPLNAYVSVIAHTNPSQGRYTSPYLKIFSHTERVSLKGVNTPHADFSLATGLKSIRIEENSLLKEINVTETKLFDTEGRAAETGLILVDVPELRSIALPSMATSLQKAIQTITIENAPLLTANINLKDLKYTRSIVLNKTNANIEFPTELSKQYTTSNPLNVLLSQNVYEANKEKADAFKQKYGNLVNLNIRK